MKRAGWISALLIMVIAVAVIVLVLRKRRQAINPPPFIAWVEISKDPKRSGALEAFPLIACKGSTYTDISFDPEDGKVPLKSLSADRFPFVAKPVVEGYLRGKSYGNLNTKSYQPTQVSCNELVLGTLEWTDKAHRATMPRGTQGFLAAYHMPKQLAWASTLPMDRRHELEARFQAEVTTRFGLPVDSTPKEFAKAWISLGPGKGNIAFFEILFKVGEELRVVNAVVKIEGQGEPKALWEVAGQGEVESDAGIPVYEFLDAFDVDGDGVPELVLGYHNYEANSFVVLRIAPGKPVELWNGSGYGC